MRPKIVTQPQPGTKDLQWSMGGNTLSPSGNAAKGVHPYLFGEKVLFDLVVQLGGAPYVLSNLSKATIRYTDTTGTSRTLMVLRSGTNPPKLSWSLDGTTLSPLACDPGYVLPQEFFGKATQIEVVDSEGQPRTFQDFDLDTQTDGDLLAPCG